MTTVGAVIGAELVAHVERRGILGAGAGSAHTRTAAWNGANSSRRVQKSAK